MKNCLRRLYLFVLLLCVTKVEHAQTSIDTSVTIESAEVQWIKQFPSSTNSYSVKNKFSLHDFFSKIAGVQSNRKNIFNKPVAIFAKDLDNIWVVDQSNMNIAFIKKDKIDVPNIFFRKKNIYQSLVGICAIPEKGILFTDSRLNKIFVINNSQKSIELFSDSLELKQPTGIAFYQAKSQIWVIETALHAVRILDINGNTIKTFGKRGTGKGEFNFPTSICIDSNGYAYIVDALNYRIQIFDNEGNFVNEFGKAGDATGYFALPKGIAIDSYGDIYVVDALSNTVQIFDKKGHFLYSFGSQGRGQGQFWMPSGIFIDTDNNIYVADSYNSRIQLFKLINVVKKA